MESMDAEIRIADLARPRLTGLQQAAHDAASPVDLSVTAVLSAARAATGLSDFGPEDFIARLSLWLESFRADEGLAEIGRATLFGECLRYAITRLRAQDLWKRHPEILDMPVDRPIMVAGLPRSGTTHLVNILGTDPRLRSVPLWESMEPIPGHEESAGPDPRIGRAAESWGRFETLLPLMPAMHEMAPDHIHEDIDLQGPDFSSYLPEWLSRPHAWRDHYLSTDQTPHYRFAKRMMQTLGWLKGPERWLVKSPPHMENLPALIAVHPTAIVPMTHRDPLAVIQSAVTMIAYGDRLRRRDVDPPALARYWIDRIERLLSACVRDRAAVPESQSVDILFHDYMADQKAVVRQVYALSGLAFDASAERRIDDFLAAHPRNRHGRIRYDLAGDFGVDIGETRERFHFYYDRFPVRRERLEGERA